MKSIFYILFTGAFALSMAGVVSCGTRGAKQEVSARTGRVIEISDSLLRIDRADTIHLGHLMQGEVIVRELTIRNVDERPFVIVGVEAGCGCTTVEYHKQPVKPNENVSFTFRFDTNGFRGWQYKTIRIRTSFNNRAHTIIITADIE